MDNVAFVFQDNMLFFDTIEENIRMGNKTATFEEVARAACAAQCHEFIESLPNGYQTLVGEGGIYLSGGEAQRIALARAILKDSPIMMRRLLSWTKQQLLPTPKTKVRFWQHSLISSKERRYWSSLTDCLQSPMPTEFCM